VPLYDTFGAEAVKFIINHSGASIVLVNMGNLKALAGVLPDLKQQLTQVVVWGTDDNEDASIEVRSVV
jgi:long-subunit acyl-CoA synthetase (AMP-forming)